MSLFSRLFRRGGKVDVNVTVNPEPPIAFRPAPVEVLVPEGAKLTPVFKVCKPRAYSEGLICVTEDIEEALHLQMNTTAKVELAGAYKLPDGRYVQAQHFRTVPLLNRDVEITSKGEIVDLTKKAEGE